MDKRFLSSEDRNIRGRKRVVLSKAGFLYRLSLHEKMITAV